MQPYLHLAVGNILKDPGVQFVQCWTLYVNEIECFAL